MTHANAKRIGLTEDLMQHARPKAGLKIEWRRMLVPASLLTLFILRYLFNAPIWALGVLCLWIPLYYVAYPMVLRKKWERFEKEFAQRFQRGEYKQLLELYKDQWFLRRFGPRAELLGKLGLIYSAMERYREAEQALERAVSAAHAAHRDRMYFNLANVKFELNKYQEAEEIYRSLRPSSPYRHAAQTQLALIDLHQERRVPVARKVLEQELKRATGSLKERIETALAQHP